jgi:hypothetical protein
MSEKSTLQAMLSQYESATVKGKETTTFDLKNYFTTYLKDGIDTAVKRVRILPIKDGVTPFVQVYLHSEEVEGKNRKFVCLAHEKDEPCPFCEAREQLLASGLESDKELAKKYRPRLMYILKVIDRENEADGPKFWRFPSAYKKDGIYDKILSNIRLLEEDITDSAEGRDLYLTVDRIKNPRGGSYPAVTSVLCPKVTPLSTNAELAASWIDNAKSWEDVYSMKDYNYLAIIVKGGVPMWSKAKEKFVDKETLTNEPSEDLTNDLDSELTMTKAKVQEVVAPTAQSDDADLDEDENDDLPF